MRPCLPGVVWRGELGPWQGMCLQIGAPFRALLIVGLWPRWSQPCPSAMCSSVCSLCRPGTQEHLGTPRQPLGTSMSPGDAAGGGSHPLLCQRRGPQALPCFAGCCDRLQALRTRFALGSGGGRGGGCSGAAANLPSSQDNSEHGGLWCSLGGSCIPLRDPHQVGESPPTIHGPAEPGEALGGASGAPPDARLLTCGIPAPFLDVTTRLPLPRSCFCLRSHPWVRGWRQWGSTVLFGKWETGVGKEGERLLPEEIDIP